VAAAIETCFRVVAVLKSPFVEVLDGILKFLGLFRRLIEQRLLETKAIHCYLLP
jgi:hypothetical protein